MLSSRDARCVFQILEQIADLGIEIYTLPECDEDEDEDYKEQCRQLKVSECRQLKVSQCRKFKVSRRRQLKVT